MKDFIISFWHLNYVLLIFSGLGAIITPLIIPLCYKWWRSNKIKALNLYLKYGINPIIQHWIIPCCIISVTLLCFILFFFRVPLYWFFLIFAIISIPAINWFYIRTLKKDQKGLVGILSDNITNVKDISALRPKTSDIFFATHVDDYGKAISYEERSIKTHKDIINERDEKIVKYYQSLQMDIENEEGINHELFIVEHKGQKMHICKFMSDIAYSEEMLLSHVEKVSKDMIIDHSINFIGDKVGINSYTIEKGQLALNIYLTDHFTFKVFKSIFLDKDLKETFQIIIRRTNLATTKEKPLLIKTLKFLLSSFGIDIIIHGKTGNGKNAMLVAVRSGNIERRGNCKLHVPVNESFSRTDINDNGKFDPTLCVIRGIEEELGIPRSLVEKAKIVFFFFSLVCDEGEIGLGCYVDFSSVMPIEQLRLYPGQDKYMEIKDILIVPYPPFYWNPDKYSNFFYKKTLNDIFSTTWESFTTLLYQRCVIRNSTIRYYWDLLYNIIIVVLINWLLFYLFEERVFHDSFYVFISNSIISVLINFLFKFICWAIKTIKSYKYTLFKPLISQWGPDVVVLQATATNLYAGDNTINNERNPVASHIIFGTNGSRSNRLSDFALEEPPYCSVRREIAKNNAESPISFYLIKPKTEGSNKNCLFFNLLPYYKEGDLLTVFFEVSFENGTKNYHFTKTLKDDNLPLLEFTDKLTNKQINSFSNCLGISKSILEDYYIAHLPEEFQNKYRPLDLFYFHDNYYWSIIEKDIDISSFTDGKPIVLTPRTDFYKEHVEGLTQDQIFYIKGTQEQITNMLVSFISNKINRQRISPLDIYILQLALIREGDGSEGIVLAEKNRPFFRRIKKSSTNRL